jgi:multidrug efflux pump
MPNFFIARPNLAWVVAIFIALAGLLAIPSLPVAQYPNVVPPQISITATYPGASARVLTEGVTSIIEEELNGAKNMLYYESTSNSNGTAEITVTFEPGTDPDLAQVDVQNRLKRADARLPTAVTRQGVRVEQANSSFVLFYALTYKGSAEDKDEVGLLDVATRRINNEIRRVKGVGKVVYFGTEVAMRVWLDPKKLHAYGVSVSDVNDALARQNVQVPAGSFGARPESTEQEFTGTLFVKGTLDTPEEFGQIVLKAKGDGSSVKLSDVARVQIGQQDYNFESRLNGKVAVSGGVQLAPGANAIAMVNAVKARIAELGPSLPNDIEVSFPYDTSSFVKASIEKVVQTLVEAVLLVFLVMLLFLQNLRYTLIPTIVVPVCLLGTFAVMSVLGFSINMMTMFGMVLAIGILVDDAIVVVENVERIMSEEGLPPREATIKAMSQVSGAIVGITLVLSAVFLPLAFMSGSVGVIYQQFSLSLAVSILFSGFLALALTPALCASLLKPVAQGDHPAKRGVFGWFNRQFGKVTDRYVGLNHRFVRTTGRYMAIYAGIVLVLGFLYARLPESFVPAEDQGYYIVDVQLPSGATVQRTSATLKGMESYLTKREGVSDVFTIMGFSFSGMGENAAVLFPTLKDWSIRAKGVTAQGEVDAANQQFASVSDGATMAVMPPPIEGMGNSGGFALRLQDRGGVGRERLIQARDELLMKANQSKAIAYAMMEGLQEAPQLRVVIDRAKAATLGVALEEAHGVLTTAFGSTTASDFANAGRLQRVVVQADARARMTPDSVLGLYVANKNGMQVPFSAFTTVHWETGPVQITRSNGYQSFKIIGDAAPGRSTGEAMAALQEIISTLPDGVGYEWTGLSYQEKAAGAQAPLLFALAILVVFLLLVALYESWSIPFSVMLIVPIGALGSVVAMTVLGMPNDVYFKVGLITIIGLAAKNAILIVEFAKELHARGHSLVDAAVEAARLRFRPIIMTSFAFILGVVPLAFAMGPGAASQRALGVGVIGGMLSATLLGVVFVPIFYVWVMTAVSRLRNRSGRKSSGPASTPETGMLS